MAPGEEDGVTAAKPPASVPASLPFPGPRALGTKQVSFRFHAFFLQLQGKLEDTEGKEGVLCGTSIKRGGNCFNYLPFPSLGVSYKVTGAFLLLLLFLF